MMFYPAHLEHTALGRALDAANQHRQELVLQLEAATDRAVAAEQAVTALSVRVIELCRTIADLLAHGYGTEQARLEAALVTAAEAITGQPHTTVADAIAVPIVTCPTCLDTHVMSLGERDVPCTQCPTPCEACRGRSPGCGPSAYCATTPCACGCHARKAIDHG